MQRSDDGCDMRRFMSFNHSACKTVLNVLDLRLRKTVVERERERELQQSSLECSETNQRYVTKRSDNLIKLVDGRR